MYISQKNVRISVKHEILVIITVYTIAIQDVDPEPCSLLQKQTSANQQVN